MWAIGEPSGPIENGTTYIVRPAMQPSNRPFRVWRISSGAVQLLVGPACFLGVGTDEGAVFDARDVARIGAGQVGIRALAGFRRFIVPASTISAHRRSYSSCEPSHQ
jgi:hypothetical protein